MNANTRVLLRGDVARECADVLAGAGLDAEDGSAWADDEVARRIADFDALIVGPAEPAPGALLRAGARLRVVGRAGVDVGGIDVDEATRRGIVVVHAPGSDVVARAEQQLALLLACARGLPAADAGLRAGSEPVAGGRAAVELQGKTLGLIGLDGSSPALAEAAQGLRMAVVACRGGRCGEFDAPAFDLMAPADVYAASDFLLVAAGADSAAAPLGDDAFLGVKHGVRLVAPAPSVDAAALARALESGRVAAAAVGLGGDRAEAVAALGGVPGVLFYEAGQTTEDARRRAAAAVAESVTAALRGDFPAGAVNVPVAAGGDAAELMPFVGLCDLLGRLLVQLSGDPVGAVDITYGGSVAYFDTGLLTLGVLGGVLAGRVDGPVNFVNAQDHARALGVTAVEHRQSDIPDYPRLITVTAGEVSVSGTSLGPERKLRLVRVFGEEVDIEPAPRMAFLRYHDAAGIGGKVGTLLGEWRVNIAHMAVGRGRRGDEAVMALTLDQPLTAAQAADLVLRCGLLYARSVEL
jgi:D-3-phosphoglycerate dehydrogenase / 2-oxoglutarate reductase